MLQVVTFGVFYTQTHDAVEQITGGFDAVCCGFKEIGSAGFGVDVRKRSINPT
jgi:hypothetical protein